MRTFLSVNLSERTHQQIEDFQQNLKSSTRGIRWTKPGNCHLTLSFLGEYPESQLPLLGEILDPVAKQCSPFPLRLGALGAFSAQGTVSIVWLGLAQGESAIRVLSQAITTALQQANISFDKKDFVPHLTIGRAQRDQSVHFNPRQITHPVSFETEIVDAFFAMQSDLTPHGPVYTPRLRFPFPSDTP